MFAWLQMRAKWNGEPQVRIFVGSPWASLQVSCLLGLFIRKEVFLKFLYLVRVLVRIIFVPAETGGALLSRFWLPRLLKLTCARRDA